LSTRPDYTIYEVWLFFFGLQIWTLLRAFFLKENSHFSKYEVEPAFEPNIYKFREYFAFNPCLFTVTINVVSFLALISIGYGLILLININTPRLYGDRCRRDGDCATDMNYLCQQGVCNCTSNTYFVSNRVGCGNFFHLTFFYKPYQTFNKRQFLLKI
jgi:hypothetical protein